MNTNVIIYNEANVIDNKNIMQYISATKTFGLIPELCGRFRLLLICLNRILRILVERKMH